MVTKKQFQRQLRKCYDLDRKLSGELSLLADMASEITGELLVADICGGNEIEFRHSDDGYLGASDDTIREEAIIRKLDDPDCEIERRR